MLTLITNFRANPMLGLNNYISLFLTASLIVGSSCFAQDQTNTCGMIDALANMEHLQVRLSYQSLTAKGYPSNDYLTSSINIRRLSQVDDKQNILLAQNTNQTDINYLNNVGNGQSYAGNNQPYPSNGQPYAGNNQSYPSNSQSYAGNNQPYPSNGQPYAGNNQPYPSNGQLYAGNNQSYPSNAQSYGQMQANYDYSSSNSNNNQGNNDAFQGNGQSSSNNNPSLEQNFYQDPAYQGYAQQNYSQQSSNISDEQNNLQQYLDQNDKSISPNQTSQNSDDSPHNKSGPSKLKQAGKALVGVAGLAGTMAAGYMITKAVQKQQMNYGQNMQNMYGYGNGMPANYGAGGGMMNPYGMQSMPMGYGSMPMNGYGAMPGMSMPGMPMNGYGMGALSPVQGGLLNGLNYLLNRHN